MEQEQKLLLAERLRQLFIAKKQDFSAKQAVMEPKQFFEKWMPRKYGVAVGQQYQTSYQCPITQKTFKFTYRQACIEEIRLYFPDLQPGTIDNWGSSFEKRPSYIPPFLFILNVLYEIQQIILQDIKAAQQSQRRF